MDNEQPKESRSYYLPRDVIEWLDRVAAAEDRSASYYLTRMLRDAMRGARD